MKEAPGLIQTTRFWQADDALAHVCDRYFLELDHSPDSRGTAQLIARHWDDGYSLSLVYNQASRKAPGPQREDIIGTGIALDEVLDFMSAFEKAGQTQNTPTSLPEAHHLTNKHIGATHITDVAERIRLERASRTQANRMRRIRRFKQG